MKRIGLVLRTTMICSALTLTACPATKTGGPAKIQETTHVDVAHKAGESGILSCGGRVESLDRGELSVQEVKVKMQLVQVQNCKGHPVMYSEIPDQKFIIPIPQGIEFDLIEITNKTTCTNRVRNLRSEKAVISALGDGGSLKTPIDELAQVKVLPLGRVIMDSPGDLAMDPSRENALEIVFKKCVPAESQELNCAKAEVVSTAQLRLKVELKGGYHRGVREEKEPCK